MDRDEARYRVTAALLQAERPLALSEVVAETGMQRAAALDALWGLMEEGLVSEKAFLRDMPGPQYCWTLRLKTGKPSKRASETSLLSPAEGVDIDSESVRAFHEFVITHYRPPLGKRFLVFFQCSVRRPFSTSTSQAFMRRAVAVATGHDPAKEFRQCPVHVVVLASKIGPVPYEFEDVFPANVRSGGVKHFSDAMYARVRPILAQRMADYLVVHGKHYRHIASFTQGRYGEVMRDAAEIAGRSFPIFPVSRGARVLRLGDSVPRTYWQRYWIQLCLEIMAWLPAPQRKRAEKRLRDLDVEYTTPDD